MSLNKIFWFEEIRANAQTEQLSPGHRSNASWWSGIIALIRDVLFPEAKSLSLEHSQDFMCWLIGGSLERLERWMRMVLKEAREHEDIVLNKWPDIIKRSCDIIGVVNFFCCCSFLYLL